MDIKKNIRQGFFEECEKNGLANVKIARIAKSAYISRGTFYLRYENIEDLTNEIEKELLDKLTEVSTSMPYKGDIKKYDWFLKVLSSEVAQIKRDYEWYALFLGPMGDSKFLDKLTDYIRTSSERKYDALGIKKDPEYLGYVTQGSLGIFLRWINNGAQLSHEELSSLMMVHLRDIKID